LRRNCRRFLAISAVLPVLPREAAFAHNKQTKASNLPVV
jgi:hypothetical protein